MTEQEFREKYPRCTQRIDDWNESVDTRFHQTVGLDPRDVVEHLVNIALHPDFKVQDGSAAMSDIVTRYAERLATVMFSYEHRFLIVLDRAEADAHEYPEHEALSGPLLRSVAKSFFESVA